MKNKHDNDIVIAYKCVKLCLKTAYIAVSQEFGNFGKTCKTNDIRK